MANLSELADLLNQISKETWTAKYLSSVLNGSLKPSDKLLKTLKVLANKLDGQSPLQALNPRAITAYSINGNEDGVIIVDHSKQCPHCLVWFVGGPWNKKYCTRECKREFRKEWKS